MQYKKQFYLSKYDVGGVSLVGVPSDAMVFRGLTRSCNKTIINRRKIGREGRRERNLFAAHQNCPDLHTRRVILRRKEWKRTDKKKNRLIGKTCMCFPCLG